MSPDGFHIRVCKGPVCAGQRHADQVHDAFVAAIGRMALDSITLDRQNCFGRCQRGPNVYVRTRPPVAGRAAGAARGRRVRAALYNGVGNGDIATDVRDILASHVLAGELVTRLIQKPDPAELNADLDAELARIQALDAGAGGNLGIANPDGANPDGGDPLGTGTDVRLAVAMRTLPDPDVPPATEEPQAETTGQTSDRDMMENG